MLNNNLRLQDIVARTSGVSLKDTVKVLRGLDMVLASLGHSQLDSEMIETSVTLTRLLKESANVSGVSMPLHTKPRAEQVKACNQAYKAVTSLHGIEELQSLHTLDEDADPYVDYAEDGN